MKKVIKVLKERRSIRRYLPKPIPKDILEDIIDCGRLAPSARNKQPWLFVVVTEKDTLKEISQLATYGKFIAEAGACVAVFGERDSEYKVQDGCIASENIIIAAKAYDIDSCWVAGFQKPYSEDVRKLLKVPEEYELVSLLSLGYSDEMASRPKKSLDEVMRWESY